jgi:flagella basal body P-ring formation protein FlgA
LNQDGDIVQLVVSSDNLIVRSKGKIMSNAMLNAKVKVLSLATNTVVDGVLVSKGIVEIDGGMP